MPWVVSAFGSVDDVCAALDRHGESLDGASREEFAAARPQLQALVREDAGRRPGAPRRLGLKASGSGRFDPASGAVPEWECELNRY